MCMHISLRPGYLQIYETSVRFFNVCHPIELKCDFSIINEFNSNRIKLHKSRFIAYSSSCTTTTELSTLSTSSFTTMIDHAIKDCEKCDESNGKIIFQILYEF